MVTKIMDGTQNNEAKEKELISKFTTMWAKITEQVTDEHMIEINGTINSKIKNTCKEKNCKVKCPRDDKDVDSNIDNNDCKECKECNVIFDINDNDLDTNITIAHAIKIMSSAEFKLIKGVNNRNLQPRWYKDNNELVQIAFHDELLNKYSILATEIVKARKLGKTQQGGTVKYDLVGRRIWNGALAVINPLSYIYLVYDIVNFVSNKSFGDFILPEVIKHMHV